MSKRKFTGGAMFAWLSSPESVPRTTLYSDQIPRRRTAGAARTTPATEAPEMDELIDAIEVELDRDARKALWHRLQALYAEDLPVIPLYWRANAYILPPWLEGLRPTGHQGTSTLWVEEWGDTR